ncbi:MAG: TIGR03936 family radical SAM-associated protein [Planctomycetota bacterium]
MVREKVRIRYRKEGSLRFLSHNDLMRCWDRLFRRAALPVRASEGFNPRPRISCPLALALGVVGVEEIIEVEFTENLTLDEVQSRLARELVPGLEILSVTRHPAKERTEVVMVEYACPFPTGFSRSAILEAREQLLASSDRKITRHIPGKPDRVVDIRPLILDILVLENEVRLRLRVIQGATARPEEILGALGMAHLPNEGMVLARTRVLLASELTSDERVPSTDCKGALHEERNVD